MERAGQVLAPEGQRPTAGLERRRFGMRVWLIGLALTLVLPSLSLGLMIAGQTIEAYRGAFKERMQHTARALALAVDRDIGSYESALAALSGSAALDGPVPDLATFEVEARRASAAIGGSIILLDAGSMRQIINTALPEGQQADRTSSADFRLPAQTRRSMVSNLVIGAVAQRPVVGVAVPVLRRDDVPYVLAARLEPMRISRLLAAQDLRDGAFAVVVDGQGNVVARSRDHDRFVGRSAPSWYMDGLVEGREGILEGAALEGLEVVAAYAPLASTAGWTIGIAEPLAAYTASWQKPLWRLAVGGTLIIGLGAVLTLALARNLLRPLAALAENAQAFAETGAEAATPTPLIRSNVSEFENLRAGFERSIAALRARAAADREAERRKALLMGEVDHRAKNALAVVLSLVRLVPRNLPPATFADSVADRIAAIARAHSLLAESGWAGGDIRAVAKTALAPHVGNLALAGPPVSLPADVVQPLSMLLHELATNSSKHGALSAADGRVSVTWALQDGTEKLQIVWSETGGPPVEGPPRTVSFGTRMIRELTQQLGGHSTFDWLTEGLKFSFVIGLDAR